MKGMTIAEKILSAHCAKAVYADDICFCTIDKMMAHDANGPMAVRAFESMGGKQFVTHRRYSSSWITHVRPRMSV